MLWATHVPGIDPTRSRNLQQMSVLPADQGGEWSARVAHGVKIGQLFLIIFYSYSVFLLIHEVLGGNGGEGV